MNGIRIIGLALLLAGIILRLTIENENLHFLFGAIIGLGIGLVITGKRKEKTV
jgi:hypothetical protein